MNEQDKNEEKLPFYELDYSKLNGIVPASILDAKTGLYLMTGYMNEETYGETIEGKQAVFWSRGRQKRWRKGEEESGNFLNVVAIKKGCENDILAIYVNPVGPVCHRGTWTCFDDPKFANITREQRFGSRCPYCGR